MLKITSMKTRLMLAIGGVSLISTLCIGAYFIVSTVRDNHAQLATYRTDLEESVGNQLKGETEVAYGILDEYYKKQQAGELTEEQAKKEAADRVRDLRYDGGKGYFWIDTVDGNNVVLLGRKDVEGTNRFNAKDTNGYPTFRRSTSLRSRRAAALHAGRSQSRARRSLCRNTAILSSSNHIIG